MSPVSQYILSKDYGLADALIRQMLDERRRHDLILALLPLAITFAGIVNHEHQREDATQEMALQLVVLVDDFLIERPAKPSLYVKAALNRTLWDFLREDKLFRVPAASQRDGAEVPRLTDTVELLTDRDSTYNPEMEYMDKYDALKRHATDSLDLLIIRMLRDCRSQDEIAAAINRTPRTVRNRIARMRRSCEYELDILLGQNAAASKIECP